MSRTIVVSSTVHLTNKTRPKIEQKIKEKFPNDNVLVLDPELSIQVIPGES